MFSKKAAEPPHHNGSSSLGEVKHAGSEENPTESLTEKSRLTELEEIIDREERSDAHLAIGNALKEINEDRLYRDAGFRAFSAYVKARFDYRVRYAYRLIEYAKEVADCVSNGHTPPTSEGSFRAAKVKEKRASRKQPKPAEPEPSNRIIDDIDDELDRFQETVKAWEEGFAVDEYCDLLVKVKEYLDEKLEEANDKLAEADDTAESNVIAFQEGV